MGSRNLLTSGIDVPRDLLCELAIGYSTWTSSTLVPVHLSFPSDTRGVFSCRSSLPCLVPNADRMLASATYPILGWDGPHRAPAPRMLRDVVWMYFQVTASMCEKAVFWRCSAARPPLGTDRQQSQYTRFSMCPPGATHSSQDYTFVQRKTSLLWTLIRFCTLLIE